MSDIFREVEEDVRRERFAKIWKQYGDYIMAAVAVIVIAVAGYKLWQRYEDQQRQNASTAFTAAQQTAASGNRAAAAAEFAKIAKTAPSGYAELAELAEANSLLASGNRSDALALFKKIANENNSATSDAARIRVAWATVETSPKSEVQAVLAPLTVTTSAWRFSAREILAYADYRAGDIKQALADFESVAKDKDAGAPIRNRANAMATFLKAGGDKEFGSVPKPLPGLPGGASLMQGTP